MYGAYAARAGVALAMRLCTVALRALPSSDCHLVFLLLWRRRSAALSGIVVFSRYRLHRGESEGTLAGNTLTKAPFWSVLE